MYVRSAGSARSAHVGNNSAKASVFQSANAFCRGIGRATCIAIPLQRRTDELHHGALIFNEQQRQARERCGAGVHCFAPAVTTSFKSVLVRTGKRTLKVAPCVSWLLAQRISPSCSRTIP